MNSPVEEFTYDLTDLNNSLSFIVAISSKNSYVKYHKNGALAVFTSVDSFNSYMEQSKVLQGSKTIELPFKEIKEIANQETEGLYQIL